MHPHTHVPEVTLEAVAEPRPPQEERAPAREMVAILDYGSQYSRLIARRVRECNVYCELLPADTTLDDLRRLGAKGVILSGGPDSVYDAGARQRRSGHPGERAARPRHLLRHAPAGAPARRPR